ncbi:MAG TPA: hypothetical protein GXX73_07645 [Clostridium sp.]|nr:hypothetical protein [Clostridium sp.]
MRIAKASPCILGSFIRKDNIYRGVLNELANPFSSEDGLARTVTTEQFYFCVRTQI